MTDLIAIVDLALEVFEDEHKALQWLIRDRPEFFGVCPIQLAGTGILGVQAVECALHRIEHGIYA